MKEIQFEHPHRQAHFKFFKEMNHPHFNICANVEITNLLPFIKTKKWQFTSTIVYVVSQAANEIKELRWRIRGEKVWEHSIVHPSFSVFTEVADVFSFCEVTFEENANNFIQKANERSEEMRKNPSFTDDEGRDDYLFLSPIPWVSFTSFQHAMSNHPTDSIPRITWGKYFHENGKVLMPLSIQVHHALVDGRHVGKWFELVEHLCRHPEKWKM